jgi:hypothetical protein
MYSSRRDIFRSLSLSALLAILIAGFFSASSGARNESAQPIPSSAKSLIAIPAGTIIPIAVPMISSEKVKKGDVLKAWVAQTVPFENGEKLYRRATVLGHVVDVTPATPPHGKASLVLRFDTVVQGTQSISVVTSLRAMASPLEVESAENPAFFPGQAEFYDWAPTEQVGGEKVYGLGGPVANGGRIVGRGVDGGVLAQLSAKPGTSCGGAVDGNNAPQALWVFSSDACGPYGFPKLMITQTGGDAPLGEIVLSSAEGPLRIGAGSAMLLCVLESSPAPSKPGSNQ